jgi:uncharacterized membrane protein
MSSTQVSTRVNTSRSLAHTLNRHWFWLFTIFFGLLVGLPFLAPVLMQIGLTTPAKGIYFIYSFLCHQLPQRSFFLFGQNTMYSLNEIQSVWQDSLNPLVLRQFIGNPELGWKVAWSDRMVSMYTSVLLFGLLWWPFRYSIKSLRWWWLILFLLPMGIDGTTHMISDLWGLGEGFRYNNGWLAELTNDAFPLSFYVGNAVGSFNSWMRLLTGVLFGWGIVWFAFPYMRDHFDEQIRQAEMQVFRTSDYWYLE